MRNLKTRFYFKACPRCRGDMYLERDAYGVFRQCLQCGRRVELAVAPRPAARGGGWRLAA